MSSCSIKWCGKNSKNSNYSRDGITFHRFPRDPSIKEAWLAATRKDDWFPTVYSVVCSRHFTADCFEQLNGNRRRLYASAIPTLLLPQLVNENDSSNHEEPPTSLIQKTLATCCRKAKSIEKLENKNDVADVPSKSSLSIVEKAMCRKVTELSLRLRKLRLAVKRSQDINRNLKIKLNKVINLLEKMKNSGSITQENIDIQRLQTSNTQLRKKVVFLKRLLSEQKKKNICAKRNVVWCPSAGDTLESETVN